MFQLTAEEHESLRSQFVTLKTGRGQHRKYLPYVFTEHGAIMAANVLNSPQAVQMSVYVVRAFVKMRGALHDTRAMAKKLAGLEADLKKPSRRA
jgi:phage regulator Rha-like protein